MEWAAIEKLLLDENKELKQRCIEAEEQVVMLAQEYEREWGIRESLIVKAKQQLPANSSITELLEGDWKKRLRVRGDITKFLESRSNYKIKLKPEKKIEQINYMPKTA